MPGLSIIHCRLLMIGAVRRSGPPAGMSGWCMCKAMAKALVTSPNPAAPGGRKTGSVPPARIASSMRCSEPQMLGRPSMSSGKLAHCSGLLYLTCARSYSWRIWS